MGNKKALLAALDAGDRDALHPLADAMLEAGDPRAAGVLWLIEHGWPRFLQKRMYQWFYNGVWESCNLPHDPTVSAAILDAAQAVVQAGVKSNAH